MMWKLLLFVGLLGGVCPNVSGKGGSISDWELDAYLNVVMPKLQPIFQETIEPLTGIKNVTLDMTFPHYLRLSGSIIELQLEGLGQFTHNYSTSTFNEIYGSGTFKIYSAYPEIVLRGRHNLEGTIELENRTILPIGGGWRDFTLTAWKTHSLADVYWELDEERRMVMADYLSLWLDLTPSISPTDPGTHFLDLGGLLDEVKDDALVENALYWIGGEITGTPVYLEDHIEDLIEPTYLAFLAKEFENITIDEILQNPPSTTRDPLTPYPGDPIRIEVVIDPPHGMMEVSCWRNSEYHSGEFTTRESMEWEFVVAAGEASWGCWAQWGPDACLNNWWEIGGITLCQGFSIYGSSLVSSAPRTNSTWLIDGRGRRRIKQWDVDVDDYRSSWDGPTPAP